MLLSALSALQIARSSAAETSCADQILADAKHALLGLETQGAQEHCDPAVAKLLQPSLRKALELVTRTDTFLDGVVPAAPSLKAGRKRGKRRRRRKKTLAAGSGVAGLEERAATDAALQSAMIEYKWGRSVCSRAAIDLAPRRQPGSAASTTTGPLGFQSREQSTAAPSSL